MHMIWTIFQFDKKKTAKVKIKTKNITLSYPYEYSFSINIEHSLTQFVHMPFTLALDTDLVNLEIKNKNLMHKTINK